MNKTTIAVLSAVGGGIVGGVVTYITVNKRLVKRYETWANDEIDSVKARYALLNSSTKQLVFINAPDISDEEAEQAVEIGRKLVARMGYSQPEETSSIFDQAVDPETTDLDADEEELEDVYLAVEGEPHLISEAEYFENEPEYVLETLTYYAVDDTLTDDKETPIDRVEETVGARHLHMFPSVKNGEKSSIYIRNDDHSTLYEIINVEQAYAVAVLGMAEEDLGLKPAKQRPKKMKRDDD